MDEKPTAQASWPESAWRLRLCLEVASSRLPALQYGIFSEEPMASFRAILNRMEKPWLAQLNEIADDERRETVRQMQRGWAWTHLFRSVTGDQVYLLIPGPTEIALMSNAL